MKPHLFTVAFALAAALLVAPVGTRAQGLARMVPYSSQVWSATACWSLTGPSGVPIACPTTSSSGLVEFVTALQVNGWNGEVDCPFVGPPAAGSPLPPNAPGAINIAGQANLPALTISYLGFLGCTLDLMLSGTPGLVFDSLGAYSHIEFKGGIISCYDGAPNVTFPYTAARSWCVLLHPRTPLVSYGSLKQMVYSSIGLPSINTYAPPDMLTMGTLGLWAGDGQFISMDIGFDVLNNQNVGKYGVMEYGNLSPCQQTMTGVHFHGNYITNTVNVGFEMGAGDPCASQIRLNSVRVTEFEPFSGYAVQDFGNGTRWEYSIVLDPAPASPTVGVSIDASAQENTHQCTTPIPYGAGQTPVINPNSAQNATRGCLSVGGP